MKKSAHGVSGKAAGRRGGGRGQAGAGTRGHARFDALFDANADAQTDLASDTSDPVLSDLVLGIGAAAWTDPETGLPPEAAILHVEED